MSAVEYDRDRWMEESNREALIIFGYCSHIRRRRRRTTTTTTTTLVYYLRGCDLSVHATL
jgi:hypothetical protein